MELKIKKNKLELPFGIKTTNLIDFIKTRKLTNEVVMLVALVGVCIILTFLAPGFTTLYNITRVLRMCSILGIIVIAMNCVIISGGIDLSVGSIFVVVAMVAVSFQPVQRSEAIAEVSKIAVYGSLPIPLLLLVCLAIGAGFGLMNGVLVSKTRITPFLLTLATMGIGRGIALFYSHGFGIQGVSEVYARIGGGFIGSIPMPVVYFIVLVPVFSFLMGKTTYGRNLYAIGTNRRVAYLSGVKVEKHETSVYVISGLLCAFSAIIFTSWTTTVEPWAGVYYEINALAAVIIGGTALSGGRGRIIGGVLGILFFSVLENGFILLAIGPYVQRLIRGIILMAIVLTQGREFLKLNR